MHTLLSLMNGALVLTEQGGVFTLSFDDKLSVGGGKAAGILSLQGKGSIVLSGREAFDLFAAIIESHVPASIKPALEAGQVLADAAIDKA